MLRQPSASGWGPSALGRLRSALAPLAIVGESLAGSAIVRVFIFWPIAVALYAAKCPVVYMGRARSDRGFAGARLPRS